MKNFDFKAGITTCLIFLFITTSGFGQNTISKVFNSEILETDRYLKIYIPPNYEIDSTKYYPLTVVLDAEHVFDVFVGNASLFASRDEAPEQIVVGINQNRYQERYEDCAYSDENSLPTPEAEEFYQFVRLELIDYMERNYRISPFKTIVGNTLTANFNNYFLIEQYPGFNAFINVNPYYAMDMPVLISEKIKTLENEDIYYYLCNGSYNVPKREEAITNMNAVLTENPNAKFKYKYDVFSKSSKTASIGQAIPSALAFIYEIYSGISTEEFETKVKDLSPADAIAYLENKYVEIEYLFGSNLKIRESDIFAVEAIVLDKENGDYLKNFGEMINKLYKDSPIGDYYIGRYYETGGKFRQALRYYKTGYVKLPKGDPNSDGYYENIARVLKKRDGTYVEPEENKK